MPVVFVPALRGWASSATPSYRTLHIGSLGDCFVDDTYYQAMIIRTCTNNSNYL